MLEEEARREIMPMVEMLRRGVVVRGGGGKGGVILPSASSLPILSFLSFYRLLCLSSFTSSLFLDARGGGILRIVWLNMMRGRDYNAKTGLRFVCQCQGRLRPPFPPFPLLRARLACQRSNGGGPSSAPRTHTHTRARTYISSRTCSRTVAGTNFHQ